MSERVAVVLLAHNEADTIEAEIRAFDETIVQRLPGAELIVAEDGSRDGTRDRIVKVAGEVPLRVVGGTERLGYTKAVEGALRSTDADWVFLCDGGAKHPPADFWPMWNARHGYDLLSGLKTNRQDQWYRQMLTVGFNVFLRILFGYHVYDADSGIRLFRRPVVDAVLRRTLTFVGFCSSEIVLRSIAAGFRYGEVPVSYRQRSGESRGIPVNRIPKVIRQGMIDLFALRRELGKR
jgi:glycosyltransferase involved in cell wall biosynthesis